MNPRTDRWPDLRAVPRPAAARGVPRATARTVARTDLWPTSRAPAPAVRLRNGWTVPRAGRPDGVGPASAGPRAGPEARGALRAAGQAAVAERAATGPGWATAAGRTASGRGRAAAAGRRSARPGPASVRRRGRLAPAGPGAPEPPLRSGPARRYRSPPTCAAEPTTRRASAAGAPVAHRPTTATGAADGPRGSAAPARPGPRSPASTRPPRPPPATRPARSPRAGAGRAHPRPRGEHREPGAQHE